MQLACQCGQAPDRILEVGFTSEGNLVVHYWCAACSRVLFTSLPLEDCAHFCPPPDAEADKRASEADAVFLQSLGIAASH
ncbi:MAG: hypothetical protein ABI759_10710 [Candidatus Solibacter sp.]